MRTEKKYFESKLRKLLMQQENSISHTTIKSPSSFYKHVKNVITSETTQRAEQLQTPHSWQPSSIQDVRENSLSNIPKTHYLKSLLSTRSSKITEADVVDKYLGLSPKSTTMSFRTESSFRKNPLSSLVSPTRSSKRSTSFQKA